MPALERVIVTGSTGFVGRALAAQLDRPLETLRFAAPDWRAQLAAMDFAQATVYHLAARVHRAQGGSEAEYMADNTEKMRALATAAAGRARRLVFLSTIKVNGEETGKQPFAAGDAPAPEDAYARSKWAAEMVLAQVASRTGLEYVIVRCPLVYGPRVTGNLLALLRLADSPLPLPFASLENRRSFVHVDDLTRLLVDCASLPQAAGHTYLAAHRHPVSTSRLISLMRSALGRPRRMFRFPAQFLEAAAAMAGQRERLRPLTRSLEVDAANAERELDWTAQVSVETAVEDMVDSYRAEAGA
jgi:nucleoside-diphosphate-sugar epimerase